ncbi:unnamed protein product, partial [Prorocentrum cordatum]
PRQPAAASPGAAAAQAPAQKAGEPEAAVAAGALGAPAEAEVPPDIASSSSECALACGDTALDLVDGKRMAGEFDSEGVLLGTELLPFIGAAGALVLPPQLRPPELVQPAARKGPRAAGSELHGFDDAELAGWGPHGGAGEAQGASCLEARRREADFARYVDAEVVATAAAPAGGGAAATASPRRPSASRRAPPSECPACALGLSSARASEAPARRGSAGRGRMHSVQCCWSGYQQSAQRQFCSLHVDGDDQPRREPLSPSRVLPPAVAGACQ